MMPDIMPDCGQKEMQVKSPSIVDTLTRQKLNLEERLMHVNNALKALEENPKVKEVLELIAKTR